MSRNMNEGCIRQAINIIKDHMSRKQIQKEVDKNQEEGLLLELMTHPGYPCVTDNGGCSIKGPDDFAKSEDRLYELKFLQSETAFKLFSEISFIRSTFRILFLEISFLFLDKNISRTLSRLDIYLVAGRSFPNK